MKDSWINDFLATPTVSGLSEDALNRIGSIPYDDLPEEDKSTVDAAMVEADSMGIFEPVTFSSVMKKVFSLRSEKPQKVKGLVSDGEAFGGIMPYNFASDKDFGTLTRNDYTDQQFQRSALVDRGSDYGSDRYIIPIYEPSGTLNAEAMLRASDDLVSNAYGLSEEEVAGASITLQRLFDQSGVEVPVGLSELSTLHFNRLMAKHEMGADLSAGAKEPMSKEFKVEMPDGSWKSIKDMLDEEIKWLAEKGKTKEARRAGKVEWQRRTASKDSPVPNIKETVSMSSGRGSTSYLMPTDLSSANKMTAGNLWEKRILPFGTVNYRGQSLVFDRKVAEGVVASFNRRAFDQVVFNLVDATNTHNDDPERVRGEVEKMTVRDDGLYAQVRTDDRGTALLSANPKLGVSPRFIPDFTREHDGAYFGPTIQHIAGTIDPHVSGLGVWSAVEMSRGAYAEANKGVGFNDTVIDMSGAKFVNDVRNYGEQSIVDGENDERNEIRGGASGSMITDRSIAELSRDNEDLRNQVVEMRRQSAESSLDAYLDTNFHANGVPSTCISAAKSILMPSLLSEGGPIEFSRTGSASVSEENPVIVLLSALKGSVPTGRQRSVQGISTDEQELAQEKHARDYEQLLKQVNPGL